MPLGVFREELSKINKPDIILVTSMLTYWYPGVFRAIWLIKEKFNDVPVVLGGIYATLCFEHAKKFSSADYIVKGWDLNKL